MDRGAWRATVHGVAKSQTWLSTHSTENVRVVPLRSGGLEMGRGTGLERAS